MGGLLHCCEWASFMQRQKRRQGHDCIGGNMRVAGLILAGGQGKRMGAEKALVPLAGQPLVAHVAARLAPQVEALALSANGPAQRFASLGLPVLPDLPNEQGEGPLAGIRAGLRWAKAAGYDALVSAATDTPFLPADLVMRLSLAGGMAHAQSAGRAHYTAALWPLASAAEIEAAFQKGERRLRAVLAKATPVIFAANPDPFSNLNTPDELALAEARIAAGMP